MAIKPEILYPGQSQAADVNYPLGSAKDVTTPGSGDGTPWIQSGINDIWGYLQGLLRNGSVTADGNVDTAIASQYIEALRVVAQAGHPNPIWINNNAVTPDSKIDFIAGTSWDVSNTFPVRVTSTIIKHADTQWIAGDGAGGRPISVSWLPSTWYHTFALSNPETGAFDAGIDTDIDATALLAAAAGDGFTKAAWTGAIYTDGATDILPFTRIGDLFIWDTPQTVATSVTISFADLTLITPPNIFTEVRLQVYARSPAGNLSDIEFKHKFQTGFFPVVAAGVSATDGHARDVFDIIADKASLVEHRYQDTAPAVYGVDTIAWSKKSN